MSNELDYSNMEMAEDAEYYDSLDAEDFEGMDDAEYADYLDFLDDLEQAEEDAEHHRKHGHHRHHKKHGHKKHGHHAHRHTKGKQKSHTGNLKGRAKLAAVGGGGNYAKPGSTSTANPTFGGAAYIHKMMTETKGDLNITVVRETANIAAVLPYILFGLNGYNSSYISTLRSYLPPGVSVVASTDAVTGDILLTYTAAGPVTDIIRITLTGSLISYSEFLQSMNTNFFKTRYIRQEYQNDSNLLLSVSQPIRFGLLSALGMKNANNLLPRSRRLNSDYQTFIVNLFLLEQEVTSEFSFVQGAIAIANTVIAWDVFMSDRINLNNM